MAGIRDITIVDSNTCESKPSESGTVKVLCSPESCGSTNLTVFRRHVASGRQLNLQAGSDYHLVYVISAPTKGAVLFKNETHEAEDGAGVLLVPGETVEFRAAGTALELLHLQVPKPPAAVDDGLPG